MMKKKQEEPLVPTLPEPEPPAEPEKPVDERKVLEELKSQTSKFGSAMDDTLAEIMFGPKEGKK
jgi:hypothetical protein